MSNEGGMLGKVKEVEDDEAGNAEIAQGQAQSAEAKTIEMLTRENAMLRQQQYHAANRMRPRASTGFGGIGNGYGLHDSVPEESSDYAVDLDESGELSDLAGKRAFGRRMSEFGAGPFRSSFSLENRPLENVKKALWSSSLGFGGLADIPQSRRHSFAEIPTRQPSIGSIGDHVHAQDQGSQDGQDFAVGQYENSLLSAANAGAYFTGPSAINSSQQALMQSAYSNMYPSQDNVDWGSAKELKELYAEEHYKWLMMFSQNAAVAQDGAGAGLMAASNGMHGGAVGGMGPPSQHHMQEPTSGELKPKLIKRHAQPHEIQALRDKEGSEAKAKRVCQSKVKDHGLNMEILDAEFQMDWKKLTFYYFADSYINFNSLVTDLFKIYKTRIWMSAINPASFASPSLGLQTPSGIGPGAVGVGRGGSSDRRQNQQQEQNQLLRDKLRQEDQDPHASLLARQISQR
ncbi:putative psp1 domain-containing protein [Diaporthe ampelina]|uniref:Putative psp1 domain-containing protein n=1 Tax=Diaporthe ampelina TaxID=1214573 RepID=A0A0G2FVM6_9PEZI|nr:putative psp1 domain-containing protein [Diaporthe ampelina]